MAYMLLITLLFIATMLLIARTNKDKVSRDGTQVFVMPLQHPVSLRSTSLRIPHDERSLIEHHRPVGTLSVEDDGAFNEVFPLYAAKNRMHRERYFYHTQTGAYNPIRLPVHYKGRNCMKDDIGCETVYDDDMVTVPALGTSEDFKVSLYENLS
jgi:hypothetical protein